jgi:hypothetical protein
MRSLFALLFALTLSACGGDYPEITPPGTATTFGAQKVTVLSGAVNVGEALSGSGVVLFPDTYDSAASKGSYALDFTLADGGSLVLVSHGRGDLGEGWEMEFRRQGAGTGSLKVLIRARGIERDTNNSAGLDVFSGFDASRPLKLQVDVHNDESPTHSLTWSRALGENYAEDQAILNTEENDNSPGKGSGIHWGLRLANASVTRAELSSPKFFE